MSTYGPVTTSGTTTYFLPMTTAFSAPPACSSLYLTDEIPASSGAAPGQMFAYDAKYQSVAGGGPLCQPTEVSLWWSQVSSHQTTAVTLLGGYTMNCPKQYTTQYNFAANTETTTIGCCPSAYTFKELDGAPNPGQCFSVIPAGEITYLQPQSNTAASWTTTSSTFASPYTMIAVQVNGYIVPNPNPTAAATSTGSTSSTSVSPSTSSTQASGSSGISSGAKAGIGIAVALGVIGVLALVGAYILVRRRRQAYAAPPEMPGNTTFQHDVVQETVHPIEMGERKQYDPPAAELSNDQAAVELDGRPHQD